MEPSDGICVCGEDDCRIILKARNKTKMFECKWANCNRKDMTIEQLKDHVEAKHISKNTTGLTCQWEGCPCAGAWKKDYELKKHLNDKHHHHGYDCEWKDCKFTCCFSSQLMHHLEDYHIGKRNKQYKCEWGDCDYETKNKKRSELVSHISKHHNHIYLFCLRCNEGFCRQQDFTRHDKNFADNPQNQSATKCAKTLPLRTPTKEESYSDCADTPQTPGKTPAKSPGRKKLPMGQPSDDAATWIKEEVDDSYVKEEPEEDEGEGEGELDGEALEYDDSFGPPDGGDINTILKTLNIREGPESLSSPHQSYHNPYNPYTPTNDFPSPRRSPSPGPSQNPFSSPSKGWNGPSAHHSPSKYLSFSDHSSPSGHVDSEHPPPSPQTLLGYQSPSVPSSPAPYSTPHSHSSPHSHPSPLGENESEPSYYPSPSPQPLQFSGVSPLPSPGIYNSPGYFHFNFSDHSSPRHQGFEFGHDAPSPSPSQGYEPSYHPHEYSPPEGKQTLPPLSTLLESLHQSPLQSPRQLPNPHAPFSRETSPFHQVPSPSSFSNAPSPSSFSNTPSPSPGSLPPFSSFLMHPPSSPGYLQPYSNPGSPGSPYGHF